MRLRPPRGVAGLDRRRRPPASSSAGTRATAGRVDGVGVVDDEVVAAARHRGVHAGAAHLLERHVLADDLSAMRGEPRYIDALPSTMNTTSQNAGMYAPPAADGPNRQHTCGTRPDSRTWLAKMRPAPRRPGNSSTWSVMRAPAESTSQTTGSLVAQRGLGEPHDLLDGARAPRPGLHRRVVGHDADRAPVDPADAGDDAVGGQVVGRARWRAARPRRTSPRRAAARSGRARTACSGARACRRSFVEVAGQRASG